MQWSGNPAQINAIDFYLMLSFHSRHIDFFALTIFKYCSASDRKQEKNGVVYTRKNAHPAQGW